MSWIERLRNPVSLLARGFHLSGGSSPTVPFRDAPVFDEGQEPRDLPATEPPAE